ncbi:MAG: hypothetical protein JWM41_867 [Gemmatimonadetes bacterium]|nr:hypothetical protein [Gemmatimonadota bacterium]
MLVPFDCRTCGEQNEVEIKMTSHGSAGSYGDVPWHSYPAEPAEWEVASGDIVCECGAIHPPDWFYENEAFDKDVQQRAVEQQAERYEDD